jgi:hypothetical protein
MAGSWEIGGPDTLVVILTREMVTMKWASSLRAINLPPQSDFRTLAGMPYDHARNTGCEEMLARGFQRILFLDDDVIMPPDGIHILKASNFPIVSGLYYRRHEPVTPVAMTVTPEGSKWITGYEKGTLFPADYVGAGCLLIQRKVLETMPAPWFEWWSDQKDRPPKERLSEDFAFCYKAKKLGFQPYVDTRVDCIHAGLSAAGSWGMKPLSL